jgi:Cof subfamily protein (haloacid dehalogenase superfamily)
MSTRSADVRLLVSDVDGTLVNHAKELTDATVAAVARWRASGAGFTVISARPRSGIVPIADRLRLDDPIAAFNGGTIFRRGGEVMECHRVPEAVARGVLAIADGAGADVWVFADDQWYATNADNPHVPRERLSANQQEVVTADFAALLGRCDKITFVSDEPALLAGLTERMRAAHGEAATIAQSQTYYLDVTALAANKGAGIEALARNAGVELAQVAAIGDQANDLPMLTRAGLAIAMGQGPEAVRQAAHRVTASNDEDGVAQAIDRMLAER